MVLAMAYQTQQMLCIALCHKSSAAAQGLVQLPWYPSSTASRPQGPAHAGAWHIVSGDIKTALCVNTMQHRPWRLHCLLTDYQVTRDLECSIPMSSVLRLVNVNSELSHASQLHVQKSLHAVLEGNTLMLMSLA